MERLPIGSVTFHLVPYPDGTGAKRRPALVLGKVNEAEYWLLEITSQTILHACGVHIESSDFEWGGLRRSSQVRCDRILTAHESLLRLPEGQLKSSILSVILDRVHSLIPQSPIDQ